MAKIKIKNILLPFFVVSFMLGHVAFAGDSDQSTENKKGCCDEMSMKDCDGMKNMMGGDNMKNMKDCDSMKNMMDSDDMKSMMDDNDMMMK